MDPRMMSIIYRRDERPQRVQGGGMKSFPSRSVQDRGGRVISPNTLTDGVTKVPKGCSEGFCHFCHLVTLGFSETHDHTLNIGETAFEG
jgi:hypothetical protein